jgi:hypothetical protein
MQGSWARMGRKATAIPSTPAQYRHHHNHISPETSLACRVSQHSAAGSGQTTQHKVVTICMRSCVCVRVCVCICVSAVTELLTHGSPTYQLFLIQKACLVLS